MEGHEGFIDLLHHVKTLIDYSRRASLRGINRLQVQTYFKIGRLIFEHEQKGMVRAGYGDRTIAVLSEELTSEFGRGYSQRNLEYMRRFYLEWRSQPEFEDRSREQMPASAIRPDTPEQSGDEISQTLSAESRSGPALSWSHYILLMQIRNPDERRFYEIESQQNDWSLRELKRQFGSGLFERLALSGDKDRLRELSTKGQTIEKPQDLLKEPYVLEFLGIESAPSYSEKELESAIIDKLEHFLLELGKGFLFEARQKRFTFDSDHFFVDLVFYNRILRCHVLIDLKIDKLTHQDLGQMQMYVNYFDRYVRSEYENPTIGIILCKTKNDALVELTMPRESNIYPKEYGLYLPSKMELRSKLMEWAEGGL